MNTDLHGLEIRHAAELVVGLKQSVLRKRSIAAGADEAELDAADDAVDTKASLAVLLLHKHASVLTKSWQLSENPEAAAVLHRMELMAIEKMSVLRKRAMRDGVTEQELEAADDAEDMRAALIEALVAVYKKKNAKMPATGAAIAAHDSVSASAVQQTSFY